MMVKSFLAWMEQAPAHERAEAVDMLAQAYLAGALGGEHPAEVEAALTLILDDPSPNVRRALAMAFLDRADVPRHIVLSLATDQAEVAGLLIARSPILQEADLMDFAGMCEGLSLVAIALRTDVAPRVCHALVKRGLYDVDLTLVGNPNAVISEADLARIVQDFGTKTDLREAMLRRDNLPASIRHRLMISVAKTLGDFTVGGGFLTGARNSRLLDETIQSGTLAIAARQSNELVAFVAHLRDGEHLTPALLLRSVLGGDLALLIHAVADLAEMDVARVKGLMMSRSDAALSAVLRRAGLPDFLEQPMMAAIRAATGLSMQEKAEGFSLPVIRAAQSACLDVAGDEGLRLLALLRRYEAEAARTQSRRIADELRLQARQELVQASQELVQLAAPKDAPCQIGEWVADDLNWEASEIGFEEFPCQEHEEDQAPDLKTIISAWKQEREARMGARHSAPTSSDINQWTLRHVA